LKKKDILWRLFGWMAARGRARPVLTRTFGFGAPAGGDWPSGYEAQVRAAYLGNPVAQRAVRIVAEGAGGVTIDVTGRGATGGDATPGDPPVHGLLAGMGQPLETVAAHLLLHGDAYVQILADADGMPAMLFALRPERVTIEPDATGWPAAYVYRAAGQALRIPVAPPDGRPGLVHIRTMHPLDDQYGLGCLGAASGPVAIHNAATRWNKALLDNAARPSGALVYDPGDPGATLSPDQFARLRGRRGTEWAMADHAAGERFVLVDADTLLAWALPASAIGSIVRISASGVGDTSPAEASLVFQARALRPPAPVAISATVQPDGSVLVGWTRRSRAGWAWLDDIDAPLGEESERYRLTATRDGGTPISIDTTTPAATVTAADLVAIGGSGGLSLVIVQIGTAAATLPPATFTLALGA